MIDDPALVYVDLQNDFCKPEYAHRDVSHFQSTLDAAGDFAARYRRAERTPILVRTVHDEHTDSEIRETVRKRKYGTNDPPEVCRPGTEGVEFVGEIASTESDVVVTKHDYSAFHNTTLDAYLSNNDVTRVLIGGVNTNVCVSTTVRDAYTRGYEVTVLSDCTTSHELEQHDRTLENVDAHFGEVRRSDEIDL